jgi:hypothetical protein
MWFLNVLDDISFKPISIEQQILQNRLINPTHSTTHCCITREIKKITGQVPHTLSLSKRNAL